MTIKNILKKLKIHPVFFFLALISILTGLFKEFSIFFIVIFVHETGHVLTSIYYNWNIESINFYPFGGLIKFDEKINKPIKEELIIVISGLIFQTFLYIVIYALHNLYCISDNVFIMFKNYHYSILFFNLIPIYPLDGIKIINLIFSKFLPFKLSHKLSIIISYIFIILFIIYSIKNYISMNTILIIGLLINKLEEERKNHKYIFNRFIFERYLYNFNFKNIKVIKNNKIMKMYRDKKHVFKINNEYITEKSLLKNKFK